LQLKISLVRLQQKNSKLPLMVSMEAGLHQRPLSFAGGDGSACGARTLSSEFVRGATAAPQPNEKLAQMI